VFAQAIHVVPSPGVSTATVGVIVVVAIVLANIVAIVPMRIAAATAPASLLTSD
jgi:ABC-type lipoprotein release transport system permease subunit